MTCAVEATRVGIEGQRAMSVPAANARGYAEAEPEIEMITIDGVPIPFASARLLLRTKRTYRERDAEDRVFLERKIAGEQR